MFKLIDYKVKKGELELNLKMKYTRKSFSSENAGEFISNNFNRIRKEVLKIIKKNKIDFNQGKIKLLVNGAMLTTLVVTAGCNIQESSNNNIKNNVTINDIIIEEQDNNNGFIEIKPPETTEVLPGNNLGNESDVSGPVKELKLMNLVLIAGHADRNGDPGAVYNNRYESEYAQELVSMIKSELSKKKNININVITEPKAMALADEMTFLKNTKSDYAISIHFNAGGGSGSEIIVPYDFADLTIAEETLNNFAKFNQPIRPTAIYSKSSSAKTSRKNGVKVASQKDYFGIIRQGATKKIQSDIIEIEFLDNEKNMKFYDQNKIKYAKGIADAIETYYQNSFNF